MNKPRRCSRHARKARKYTLCSTRTASRHLGLSAMPSAITHCHGDDNPVERAGSSTDVLRVAAVSEVVHWDQARGSQALPHPPHVAGRRILPHQSVLLHSKHSRLCSRTAIYLTRITLTHMGNQGLTGVKRAFHLRDETLTMIIRAQTFNVPTIRWKLAVA